MKMLQNCLHGCILQFYFLDANKTKDNRSLYASA